MADVFLSYARKEREKAEPIREALAALGLTVFFDVDELDGGDVFPDVLDREVKTAGAVVSLWSPHALTRPWIKIESRIGKDRGVLIPVEIGALDSLLDVPAAFYDDQRIDLIDFNGDTSSSGWLKLVKSLARTLERPDLLEQEARIHAHTSAEAADLPAELATYRKHTGLFNGVRGLNGVGAAFYGLCVVSLIATVLGLSELMDIDTANFLNDVMSKIPQFVLATLVTIFVIAVMVVTLARALKANRWYVQTLYFMAYALFAFWSVTFGYGFFWKNFSSQQYTEQQFTDMVEGASRALTLLDRNLVTVVDAGDRASSLAAIKAEVERTQGNSCSNRTSAVGAEPLLRSRQSFETDSADLVNDLKRAWTSRLQNERQLLEWRLEAVRSGTVPNEARTLLGASSDAIRSALLAAPPTDESVLDDEAASVPTEAPELAETVDQANAAEDGPEPPEIQPDQNAGDANTEGVATGPLLSIEDLLETGETVVSSRSQTYRLIADRPTRERAALLQELESLAGSQALTSAERGAAFNKVYDGVRAFAEFANSQRELQAQRFAERLDHLAARASSDNEAFRASDDYCEDEELANLMNDGATTLRSLQNVTVPEFRFVEGPAATQRAIQKLAGLLFDGVTYIPRQIGDLFSASGLPSDRSITQGGGSNAELADADGPWEPESESFGESWSAPKKVVRVLS